jgi:hypothetical protein
VWRIPLSKIRLPYKKKEERALREVYIEEFEERWRLGRRFGVRDVCGDAGESSSW